MSSGLPESKNSWIWSKLSLESSVTLSPCGPKKSSVVSFKSISVVELSLAGGKIEPVKKKGSNLLSELTLIVEVSAA